MTKLSFLIDTGAADSVVPPRPGDRDCPPSVVWLQAANGTAIAMFGKRRLELDLGLRRSFRRTFIITEVMSPILGTD